MVATLYIVGDILESVDLEEGCEDLRHAVETKHTTSNVVWQVFIPSDQEYLSLFSSMGVGTGLFAVCCVEKVEPRVSPQEQDPFTAAIATFLTF